MPDIKKSFLNFSNTLLISHYHHFQSPISLKPTMIRFLGSLVFFVACIQLLLLGLLQEPGISSNAVSSVKNIYVDHDGFMEDSKTPMTNHPQSLSTVIVHNLTKDDESLHLNPGELPGYTGWLRPRYTLAGEFEIETPTAIPTIEVGNEWSLIITCPHQKCIHGGSHFFVRAYGPAVITGRVHDFHNGSYQVLFVPFDAGLYTVEVVLVSSKPPAWNLFPLDDDDDNDPLYEGFMLPNFPLSLVVIPPPHDPKLESLANNTKDNRLCSFDQMVERGSTPTNGAAYRKARWVPVDKVAASQKHRHDPKMNAQSQVTDPSFEGYLTAHNSLGIMMEYVPTDCALISSLQLRLTPSNTNPEEQTTTNPIRQCFSDTRTTLNSNQVHVVFIGDSVTRLQSKYFESLVAPHTQIRTTLISTSAGIVETLPQIKKELNKLLLERKTNKEHIFIMFNTGLHDILRLCSPIWKDGRKEYLEQNHAPSSNISCVVVYRNYFQKLVDFLQNYPADLRVFQSTTAGWPRYGNYNVGWSPNKPQFFSLSSNIVSHFNEIAYKIVSQAPDIYIMDAYWMTLARPDNRQMKASNSVGARLVHPGLEVIHEMGRIWWMILARTICNHAVEDIVNDS